MKWRCGILAACLMMSSAAEAQSPLVIGAVGQTVGRASGSTLGRCDVTGRQNKPKAVTKFHREAEPALQKYLALAAMGKNPGPAFKRRPVRVWALDGEQTKQFGTIRDSWASQTARLELVGWNLGVSDIFGHAVWRAYAADHSLLGTYDAVTVVASEGHRLVELRLWSPGQEGEASPISPFCARPGDYETWLASEAEQQRSAQSALEQRSAQSALEKP